MSRIFSVPAAALTAASASRASAGARLAAAPGANGLNPAVDKKLKANARDFESMFLEGMVDRLYTNLGENGPLGAAGAGGDVWRSMLAKEHAHAIAKSGGVGMAAGVYDELVKIQARASGAPAKGVSS